MTDPLHDPAEATVQLGKLHSALLQALREKRWADAADLSAQSGAWHVRLQAHLSQLVVEHAR